MVFIILSLIFGSSELIVHIELKKFTAEQFLEHSPIFIIKNGYLSLHCIFSIHVLLFEIFDSSGHFI